jgi:tetratricopeptide (TPR) repeat protein
LTKTLLLGLLLCVAGASSATALPPQGAAESAAAFYGDGVKYALEGRLDEAAAAFEQVVRLDRKNGDAHFSLGNIYAEQGRWGDAARAYRQAVGLRKRDGEAFNGLGLALAGAGEYEQAAEAFKRAAEIYPQWAEPRFHLSQVYRKLGRDVAAQVAYSETLERRPDYSTNPPRSFTNPVVKSRAMPRGERAATTVNAATDGSVATTPGDEDAARRAAPPRAERRDYMSAYELGLKNNSEGRYEEAIAALKQAVGMDRNNAGAFWALGAAYAGLGRWRESVDAYEQAVRLDPRDTKAFEMLGRSYAKLRETTPNAAPPPPAVNGGSARAVGANAASTSGPSPDAGRQPEKAAAPASNITPTATRNAVPGAETLKPESAAARPAADPDPSAVYRVGPRDVLEVLAPGVRTADAFEVTPSGLLVHPRLPEPLRVEGLTTDEIASRLNSELKRRGVASPNISVGVREYVSHSIIVSGMVKDPGAKVMRREGVPLYVIVAHAQPLPGAGQALVVSHVTGRTTAVSLSDSSAMSMLVRPGDVITVRPLPKQFFYIAGAVRQPGQREFHEGLTLTQAVMAAGGDLPPGASVVAVTRQDSEGRLATTRHGLKEIRDGRAPDPLVRPGDRLEVLK